MRIEQCFDAVIMLTWSDWKTEPRSNRYHYAKRFAQHVPVLFVQPWALPGSPLSVEITDVPNVDIVHATYAFDKPEVAQLRGLLRSRGIKRPLLWIYNSLHFQSLIDDLEGCFKVYHATEDYFTESEGLAIDDKSLVKDSIRRLLPKIDLLVSVSSGVVRSFIKGGNFTGDYLVLNNGCDAEFLFECAWEVRHDAQSRTQKKIAIFQGGINQRLDYDLLMRAVRTLPNWEFRFCGAQAEIPGWKDLLREKNVKYLGALDPRQIAHEMARASVGIIPFIQDQWIRNSLPLKAYEYVACGLPVVTVPIDALADSPELFSIATAADVFIEQIQAAHARRHDPELLVARASAARENSYDARFTELVAVLAKQHQQMIEKPRRLNVAILFDEMSTTVGTIREHLDAFPRFSKNDISFVSCTNPYATPPAYNYKLDIDLSIFDVVIVHYSVRLSLPHHLNQSFATALENFGGLKVLFIQDEYEGTELARSWMDRIHFDIVYTCVPQSGLEHVYPDYRFPATDFLPTLTGYVPENANIERFVRPLSERKLLVGYRGRKLPTVYGRLGYEKYQIGLVVKSVAAEMGLLVDVEVDDSSRIYGDGWYAFLGSVRATLGTESGANIFDFDGSLKKQIAEIEAKNLDIGFDEISERLLSEHEGLVRMNQISPKIFEAIRLRTALVLFEGDYSGVVQANEHYIPLKKDFSNLKDILEKLKDDALIEALTQRAYDDIVASGKYSYRRFVELIDADIDRRVLHAKKRKILVGTVYFLEEDGSLKTALPMLPLNLMAGASLFDCKASTSELTKRVADLLHVQALGAVESFVPTAESIGVIGGGRAHSAKPFFYQILRWTWHRLSTGLRRKLLVLARSVLRRNDSETQRKTLLFRIARRGWHLLPSVARIRLARLVGRN